MATQRPGLGSTYVVCAVPRVALLALLCPPVLFPGTETATTTSSSDPVQESAEAPVKVTLTVTATPGVQ